MFGSFLVMSGAGSFFIDLGLSLFGKYRGGPAKAAVLGSCMFGSITGSQVANVAAVGVLTIPLMKRVGYRPIVAASIEALASTGGMLIPPVMGAVAFIIPEMIGGTYWDVCKAAIIPGLLFYTSVYMVVELQSAKFGLRGLPLSELPRFKKVLLERGHMMVSILVLVYCVAVLGMSTPRAGFWAMVACLAMSQFRSKTRMNVKKTAIAIEKGVKGSLMVVACCASAGLITGVISMTGLGMRFSDILVAVAGGSMLLLLFLTMIASLILGLPLPAGDMLPHPGDSGCSGAGKGGSQSHGRASICFLFRCARQHQPPGCAYFFCCCGSGGNRPGEDHQSRFPLFPALLSGAIPLCVCQ